MSNKTFVCVDTSVFIYIVYVYIIYTCICTDYTITNNKILLTTASHFVRTFTITTRQKILEKYFNKN